MYFSIFYILWYIHIMIKCFSTPIWLAPGILLYNWNIIKLYILITGKSISVLILEDERIFLSPSAPVRPPREKWISLFSLFCLPFRSNDRKKREKIEKKYRKRLPDSKLFSVSSITVSKIFFFLSSSWPANIILQKDERKREGLTKKREESR